MPRLYDSRYLSHKLDRLDAIQGGRPEPPDARDEERMRRERNDEIFTRAVRNWMKDGDEPTSDLCAWCGAEVKDDEHAPYCSTRCAVHAEGDSHD